MVKKVTKKPGLNKWVRVIGAVLISLLIIGFALLAQHSSQNGSASSPAGVTKDHCAGKADQQPTFDCYKGELTTLIQDQNPEAAFALLKQQYSSVPYVQTQCHQLTHLIGRAAYDKYKNLGETFAHGDQFCNAGFYHGLSEELAKDRGVEYLLKNSNTICEPIATSKGRYSFYHFNCVHGMGHGFMEVLSGDLPKSLKACDQIKDDWERNSCYGGVFMQNIMIEQSPDDSLNNEKSKYLDPKRPMYPCTSVAKKYKTQCYLMQTSYALTTTNDNWGKVFGLCSDTPAPYNKTCYESLGRDASGYSVYDPEQTLSLCGEGFTAESRIHCVIGALRDYEDNFQNSEKASELCKLSPRAIQKECLVELKSYAGNFK